MSEQRIREIVWEELHKLLPEANSQEALRAALEASVRSGIAQAGITIGNVVVAQQGSAQ